MNKENLQVAGRQRSYPRISDLRGAFLIMVIVNEVIVFNVIEKCYITCSIFMKEELVFRNVLYLADCQGFIIRTSRFYNSLPISSFTLFSCDRLWMNILCTASVDTFNYNHNKYQTISYNRSSFYLCFWIYLDIMNCMCAIK